MAINLSPDTKQADPHIEAAASRLSASPDDNKGRWPHELLDLNPDAPIEVIERRLRDAQNLVIAKNAVNLQVASLQGLFAYAERVAYEAAVLSFVVNNRAVLQNECFDEKEFRDLSGEAKKVLGRFPAAVENVAPNESVLVSIYRCALGLAKTHVSTVLARPKLYDEKGQEITPNIAFPEGFMEALSILEKVAKEADIGNRIDELKTNRSQADEEIVSLNQQLSPETQGASSREQQEELNKFKEELKEYLNGIDEIVKEGSVDVPVLPHNLVFNAEKFLNKSEGDIESAENIRAAFDRQALKPVDDFVQSREKGKTAIEELERAQETVRTATAEKNSKERDLSSTNLPEQLKAAEQNYVNAENSAMRSVLKWSVVAHGSIVSAAFIVAGVQRQWLGWDFTGARNFLSFLGLNELESTTVAWALLIGAGYHVVTKIWGFCNTRRIVRQLKREKNSTRPPLDKQKRGALDRLARDYKKRWYVSPWTLGVALNARKKLFKVESDISVHRENVKEKSEALEKAEIACSRAVTEVKRLKEDLKADARKIESLCNDIFRLGERVGAEVERLKVDEEMKTQSSQIVGFKNSATNKNIDRLTQRRESLEKEIRQLEGDENQPLIGGDKTKSYWKYVRRAQLTEIESGQFDPVIWLRGEDTAVGPQ